MEQNIIELDSSEDARIRKIDAVKEVYEIHKTVKILTIGLIVVPLVILFAKNNFMLGAGITILTATFSGYLFAKNKNRMKYLEDKYGNQLGMKKTKMI